MQDSDTYLENPRQQQAQPNQCRRNNSDRRSSLERRYDRRNDDDHRQSIKTWVKNIFNPRLGVDRRKGVDQRSTTPSQSTEIRSLLTPDEISDLLK